MRFLREMEGLHYRRVFKNASNLKVLKEGLKHSPVFNSNFWASKMLTLFS